MRTTANSNLPELSFNALLESLSIATTVCMQPLLDVGTMMTTSFVLSRPASSRGQALCDANELLNEREEKVTGRKMWGFGIKKRKRLTHLRVTFFFIW